MNIVHAQPDWLVHQIVVHAAPALDCEIRRLNKWRNKINIMMDEKSLNVEQRATLTAILDQLARRGIIYAGAENDQLGD